MIQGHTSNIAQPESENKMPTLLLFSLAFISYTTAILLIKKILFKKLNLNRKISYTWNRGMELIVVLLSPDIWLAFRFKNIIKSENVENHPKHLTHYVKKNNLCNLWISTFIATLTLTTHNLLPNSTAAQFLIYISIIRLISRSVELIYAFSKDAIQEKRPSTSLNKYDRIKLALKSYAEIYIYSAPAYLIFDGYDALKAISLTLNVGTLTNVGQAFNPSPGPEVHLIFVQVFTTLCLAILSLASYISRSEE